MRITIKVFVVAVSILMLACHNKQETGNSKNATPHENKMYVEVQPFETEHGWGYNIFVDKKLYISQGIIPGIAGTSGFKTKDDAMNVGRLALQKMSVEKRRPVITLKDLSELHIDTN